ncbi:hybrid sensor histidine kinase/response regulator [Dyella choica]|uniref:Chemotaxis protein CheA n=1 Tax=Dyella choica TaxID=1927959 RepID=A0A432MAX1_9GAMM|nr:response regulator [Dyella choica]RUL78912.1 hybrid sensor histidine kinase/response regulator [Dyella choica]
MTRRTTDKKSDDLLERLRLTFQSEADEHLKSMSSGLLTLEQASSGESKSLIEAIFRSAHSLKGAAQAVNLEPIGSVCQPLESVLAALKAGRLEPKPALLNLLHESLDTIGHLVSTDAASLDQRLPLAAAAARRLDDALKGKSTNTEQPDEPVMKAPADTPYVAPNVTPETVRVSIAKLDTVMRHVEELLAPRLAASQRLLELNEAVSMLSAWKKQRARLQPALRVIEHSLQASSQSVVGEPDDHATANGATSRKQELSKLLEYLDSEQVQLKVIEDHLARLSRSTQHDQRVLTSMSDSLLRDCKEMQLLPFSSLLEGFPRFVRELAREQGKTVELSMQGGDIEIDRRILDAMKDPLIHLLRNSIDHGIATPAVRGAKGKPARGTIMVAISQKDSGKVEVVVADDGAGIDVPAVKAAASKLKNIALQDGGRMDEQEAMALVFKSGLSTSPIITDVSGRGLGLAIVREKVEKLGGSIAIESRRDAGTVFRIVLPLMLANFHGLIVREGGQLLVIPTIHVERVMRLDHSAIRTVENRETIPVNAQAVSLVGLGDVLEMPRSRTSEPPRSSTLAVVIEMAHVKVAFRVDEVLGEHEVLVKPLGRQLVRVRNVAGASVLGTGQVVPVLNVSDLLKSAMKQVFTPRAAGASPDGDKGEVTEKRSILVVEDSITSRSLLKGILETAGYQVSTAVDGMDGFTTLKTGKFDLVVSDVEMPRMDGFDLTAKLRADKQLSDLPVVLVTALGSREHRERGIDVGANAYIVKSQFDQSNLLDAVRRLV